MPDYPGICVRIFCRDISLRHVETSAAIYTAFSGLQRVCFLGVNTPEREASRLPVSSATGQCMELYLLHPIRLHVDVFKPRDSLYLYF
jgi:hypothetical protein